MNVKNGICLQLQPARYVYPSALLSRTTPEALRKIDAFAEKGRMRINAGREKFLIKWTPYEIESSIWPHKRPAVVVQALHNYRTCGFGYFEVLTISRGSPAEIADMTNLMVRSPNFQNPYPTLWPTTHTLRIAKEYRQKFRGLGTTILSLLLHLAARRGAVYLSGKYDISDSTHPSGHSFYCRNGFTNGVEINLAMLKAEMMIAFEHAQDEKVFYLNGVFDDDFDFSIPEIGISLRPLRVIRP